MTWDRAGNLYVFAALGGQDAAWLESSAADQSDTSAMWSVHFGQVRNATTSSPFSTEVSGPTVRTGAICTLGIVCPDDGSRNLGDFMEIALDSFGYAHVAVPAGDQGGAIRDIWWRQDAGPSATTLPCAGGCTKTRPGPTP